MKALIFGAGKIARGFIGQLLYRNGAQICFAESNEEFARRIDDAGKYYVNVMGAPEESEWIRGYRCFSYADMEEIASALLDADMIFTSVVGKNLEALGKTIAQAYAMRRYPADCKPRTIITCENWKEPSALLRASIRGALSAEDWESFDSIFGITEAVVMRSAVEATPEVLAIDPLAVSVHNFWDLPIDAARFKGERYALKYLRYLDHFAGFLQQKVFTYNGGNATIAYLGTLKGHKYLYEAANDPEIVQMLGEVYSEINAALSRELNIPLEQQQAFAQTAIRKYQDRSIIDFTERHARDPLRKLGPDDRIVGVARMIMRQGIQPFFEARTLAAALYYSSDNANDPSYAELERMRREEGVDAILRKVCKIDPGEELGQLVHTQIDALKRKGWIK